jgi:HSP20 family protein
VDLHRVLPVFASGKAWEARVDVIEDDHRIILKAEVAGVRGEDIQLLYIPERHSVLIRGLRREEEYEDGERTNFYQLEIFYGPFQREVRLPDVSVRSDQIKANYRNGFLIVLIPKQETVVVQTLTIKKI